jgi:protein-tyrosine phosphatase
VIDLHCHILPGIDDGPATIEEALEMCRIAASDGIHTIVATPHYSPDNKAWSARDISERIERLEAALLKLNVKLAILPGAEIAIFPELPKAVAHGTVPTMNNKRRCILAEFPFDSAPPHWEAFLQKVLDSGIVPLISHPERNGWFLRHPEAVTAIVRRGGLIQITAMSLLGGFGEEVRDFSLFLLRHKLAHVIATDAHSVVARPPKLTEAVRVAARVIGEAAARELVTSVPQAIIEGRAAPVPEPVEFVGKKEPWLKRVFRSMARS